MSHENVTFRKAARDAGIRGEDRSGNDAIEMFSEHYHNTWAKWEREEDGYEGIYQKARDWWRQESWKYR